MQKFAKYDQAGDYHWKSASDTPWWRRDVLGAARYSLAAKILKKNLQPGSWGIDAGCGDGVMLFELHNAGFRTIGVDGEPSGLKAAKARLAARRICRPLVRADVCELPFSSGGMSFVIALDVIEHLNDVGMFATEAKRVLRPGGFLVVTTPAAGVVLRDPYHVREFTRSELHSVLSRAFGSVRVSTFTPESLVKLYRPQLPAPLLNRAVAGVHRAAALIGFNPFDRLAALPGGRDLLAIARSTS